MRLLYVDNFRGFKKTFIPIYDVNFFVGENSTGKTSILSLIRLLSSPYFWFEQDFNQENVQLGSFKDIVNVDSTDRSFFKIGLIECNDNCKQKDIKSSYVFLFTFRQIEALPSLFQYSYLHNDNAITARISNNVLTYRAEKVSFSDNAKEELLGVYSKWIKNDFPDKEFKIIHSKIPKRNYSYVPSIIQGIIAEDLKLDDYEGGIRIPDFGMNQAWIAPIRSKPKRTYDEYKFNFSPEGDHAPYLIRKLLSDKSKVDSFKKFLTAFGKNSGLFRKITTKQFGKSAEAPFELDVSLRNKPINIEHVGYGVSQCLPIIVELFARAKACWFTIQQPEVHLHPRAQAALGEIFYYFAKNEKKKLLIETHSDFTIDRFRLSARKDSHYNFNSQVLFFERTNYGNKVTSLQINKNGDYPDNQPDSFREFFVKEELSLLGLV